MPLDAEDLEPRHKKPAPLDLQRLSIGELKARAEALEAEIVEIRAVIKAKESAQSAADSVFKR